MVYFLINNNYHYYDLELHLPEFAGHSVSIVEIPHTLDVREYPGVITSFRYSPTFNISPLKMRREFIGLTRRISEEISPNRDDTLFIYTEYELLNQFVVNLFKKVGARVFLLEDGGIGTYIPFRKKVSEPLNAREYLRLAFYKTLPGLRRLRFHKVSGIVYPWMPDESFSAVCIYQPVRLARNIPSIVVQRPAQSPVAGIPGRVVFLNQDLYAHGYLSAEQFLAILTQLMAQLCFGFGEVLFKYHPREEKGWKERIDKEVLGRFPSITVIPENQGIETTVERYRPSVAASFNSTGLFNLYYRGIQPLYLYHLFPQIAKHADFLENTTIFNEMGYKFVQSLGEVNEHYQSGLNLNVKHVAAQPISALL